MKQPIAWSVPPTFGTTPRLLHITSRPALIYQAVVRTRLLLAVALLLCAVPTAQAIRSPVPQLAPASPLSPLNEDITCSGPDVCYVVWVVDSDGRIGLFVGNNPINQYDPDGLKFFAFSAGQTFPYVGGETAFEQGVARTYNMVPQIAKTVLPLAEMSRGIATALDAMNWADQRLSESLFNDSNAIDANLMATPFGGLIVGALKISEETAALTRLAEEAEAAQKAKMLAKATEAARCAALRARAVKGTLTAAERTEIEAIANKYNTTIDVVGSRAAGKGRNIETTLPVGKDPSLRSDIDFRIDASHPQVGDLIKDLKGVGGGAGSASTKYSTTTRPTQPPFIRFEPNQ
jgi:hypothetical protein